MSFEDSIANDSNSLLIDPNVFYKTRTKPIFLTSIE